MYEKNCVTGTYHLSLSIVHHKGSMPHSPAVNSTMVSLWEALYSILKASVRGSQPQLCRKGVDYRFIIRILEQILAGGH